MKLADLNKNNIDMGHSRTVEGDSFEFSVPMSQDQSMKSEIDDETDDANDEIDSDIPKLVKKTIDVLGMANSWAPKRNLPDIRKVPNTANVI